MQHAFDKCMHLWLPMLLLPDRNKWFDNCTDASDFQLGACIVQEGRPVAYFSCKLSKLQQNYTLIVKEMLSIIATLEEFHGMLLDTDPCVLLIIKI